jgi:hypothetical protein
MLGECLRLLAGPDGPRRSALLDHLRHEAESSSRRLFAGELVGLVRRGRAGWRQAAGALAELRTEGPTALGEALLGCRSAAAQARLLGALAGAADQLPAGERVPLLMLTSGLWFGGRTPAVKEAAWAAAQTMRGAARTTDEPAGPAGTFQTGRPGAGNGGISGNTPRPPGG